MKIEQFNEVIALICDGFSLRKACKELSYHRRDFDKLVKSDPELNDQYTRAREERADKIFEEILEIADDSSGDKKYTENGEVLDSEYVARSRIKIDARKWMLGKMQPKTYGDKQIVEGDINQDIKISFK